MHLIPTPKVSKLSETSPSVIVESIQDGSQSFSSHSSQYSMLAKSFVFLLITTPLATPPSSSLKLYYLNETIANVHDDFAERCIARFCQ